VLTFPVHLYSQFPLLLIEPLGPATFSSSGPGRFVGVSGVLQQQAQIESSGGALA